MIIKKIVLESNKNHSPFASEKYLSTQSNEYGWIGAYQNDKLIIVLPYIVKKVIKIFTTIQFTTSIIFFKELSILDEKEFLDKVILYFKNKNIDFIQAPPANALFRVCPDNSLVYPFGSYVLDLSKSIDQLFNNQHKKHKKSIRQKELFNFKIVEGVEYLEDIIELVNLTHARTNSGTFSLSKYKKLKELLEDNLYCYAIYEDNIIQSCVIYLASSQRVYGLIGGTIYGNKKGVTNILHWEAIKFFKQQGLKYYDFMGARLDVEKGSKIEGIQRFKSRFGGELETGYLWKYIYKPYKYKLFLILKKIQYKLRGSKYIDIIDEYNKKHTSNI